jgi:hypothetical protein
MHFCPSTWDSLWRIAVSGEDPADVTASLAADSRCWAVLQTHSGADCLFKTLSCYRSPRVDTIKVSLRPWGK